MTLQTLPNRSQVKRPAQHADKESAAFEYGSVWLVSAKASDPNRLPWLTRHALGIADAVIHDPGIPAQILDLVPPPRYREAAEPCHAIERSIKLAEDGWRVVWLIASDELECAVEAASRFVERNMPLRIVPDMPKPVATDWPNPLLSICIPVPHGCVDAHTPVALLTPFPRLEAPVNAEQRHAPPGFSMSGLAG